MENLILWGAPVLGLLMGLGSRLYRSYLIFFHLLFASYLAISLEEFVSGFYSLPGEADAYRPILTLAALMIVSVILFVKIVEQISNGKAEYDFGPIDKIGGGICGFAGAVIVVNFAVYLLCVSPQKTIVENLTSLTELERACTSNLIRITDTVDQLSFQSTKPGARLLRLEELLRRNDPVQEETEQSETEKPKEPAPQTTPTKKPQRGTLTDSVLGPTEIQNEMSPRVKR